MAIANPTVFLNGSVILPGKLLRDGAVVCRGGRILSVTPRKKRGWPKGADEIDARGGLIGPGYVDVHVHGGEGADFMDGTAEAVRTSLRAHARRGSTSLFPTTTTGSEKQVQKMLLACKAVKKAWTVRDGSRIAGVHFYGPYFAEPKVGCHLKEGRRDPDPREYKKDFDIGIIQIATCAAELPGAEAFYREARRRGYLITCGHSDASWAEMAKAFAAGMRHVDHFWCAMSSIASVRARFDYPMQGSMAEFVLAEKEMSTEVLADGCHLAPELLEFAFRMKGEKRLLLVTDSNRAMGMPPGKYRFGPGKNGAWFLSNGKVGYQPGRGLASAIVGMDTMVRNMKNMTSASIPQAVRMGSLTPAERAGVAKNIGSLEAGKFADINLLDRELNLQRTFIGGTEFK